MPTMRCSTTHGRRFLPALTLLLIGIAWQPLAVYPIAVQGGIGGLSVRHVNGQTYMVAGSQLRVFRLDEEKDEFFPRDRILNNWHPMPDSPAL